jgi:hypothetical protein
VSYKEFERATEKLNLRKKLSLSLDSLEKDFGDPDAAVVCPFCKGCNNHMVGHTLLIGTDEYESGVLHFNSKGTLFADKDVTTVNRNRNLSNVLYFFCEEGHEWSRTFAFHKGMTYVKDTDLGQIDDDLYPRPEDLGEPEPQESEKG